VARGAPFVQKGSDPRQDVGVTGPRRVLVVAPMTSELKPVVRLARAAPVDRDGIRAYRGQVGDVEVTVTQVGVGPAAARDATRRALAAFPVDHVIVCGIAGGLAPDLPVGSVMVPATVVDLASGARFRPASLEGLASGGTVAAADHLITDPRRLAELTEQGVAALEMESSGVAAACEDAQVPWTTVRVIGDRPDEGLTDDAVMSFLRPDGSADGLEAVRFMVTHPGRIPGMVRLGRDSSMAAAKAARVTLGALGWKQ
jgi:nucleoside phosphorylase